MHGQQFRVVQWATGNIGGRALREVIRHPALELVGVLVYDPAKEGVDAGSLCGEEPTGVVATTDRAAVHALDADCVLYMPRTLDVSDVVALLESGNERRHDARRVLRRRIRARRRRSGARRRRVHARPIVGVRDGEQPRLHHGCASLRTAVAPATRRVDRDRRVREPVAARFAALALRADGLRPSRSRRSTRSGPPYLLGEFQPALGVLAEAAGRPVDAWTCVGEVAAARRATTILAGELAAGSVAAQRTTIVGTSDGAEVVRFRANWYCTDDRRPRVGSPIDRMEGASARRRAARRRSRVSRSRSTTWRRSHRRTPRTGR